MARAKPTVRAHVRTLTQLAFTALTNGYLRGFATGTIYKGSGKLLCLPGLNCYSCPGAFGACPIGAFQAVLASRGQWFSYYMVGFFLLVGAVCGRFVCGWLCPFGLVQDLLHRLPGRKLRSLPGEKWLRRLRYAVLAVLVVLLPLLVWDLIGQGQPWFCTYLCPSGTLLAGLPLLAANQGLRGAAGGLFAWKLGLLLVLLLLSVFLYRPFCRYLCPLGAIYGLFNPLALYRFRVEKKTCTNCGRCRLACPLDIPVQQQPNSPDCVRCGKCLRSCPQRSLHSTFSRSRPEEGGPDER